MWTGGGRSNVDGKEGSNVDRREGSGVDRREGSDADRRGKVMQTEGRGVMWI